MSSRTWIGEPMGERPRGRSPADPEQMELAHHDLLLRLAAHRDSRYLVPVSAN